MSAHTPGPWNYERQGTVGDWKIIGPETEGEPCRPSEVSLLGKLVSFKPGVAFTIYHEENARLIAASPDMLQALECIVAVLSQNKTFPADINYAKSAAEAAIAKAIGKSV